ncbi:MAG: hypothetical protein RL885_01095 [Planctomycetota bacterium]
MNRRSLFLIVPLLGLAILALWLLNREPAARPTEKTPAAEEPGSDVAAVGESGVVLPERVSEEVVEGEPSIQDTDPSDAIRVLVRTESGSALKDVPVCIDVSMRENPRMRRSIRQGLTGEDGIAVIAREAWRRETELPSRSNEELRVEIACGLPLDPRVGVEIESAASLDELVELVVPDSARRWLEDLRVLVVDESNRPQAGVPVELAEKSLRAGSSDQSMATATTNDEGFADLPLEKLVERLGHYQSLGIATEYLVTVDLALADVPRIPVSFSGGRQVIRLVLPSTATLEIEVLDHESRPVTAAGSVALFWRDPAAATTDTRFDRLHDHIRQLEAGVATYERVGLGLEFQVSAGVSDGSSGAKGEIFLGPTTAGETQRVTVQLSIPSPWVTGRVVDENRRPIPSHYLVVEDWSEPETPRSAASGPKRPGWLTMTTDADGRFRFQVVVGSDQNRSRHLRFLEKESPGGDYVANGRWARRDIPVVLSAGSTHDLGDVQMEAIPILVAGRTVLVDGTPLGSVYVTLQHPYGPPDERRWTNDTRVSADANGYFEMRDPGEWDVIRIRGHRLPDHFGSSEDIVPGSTDVVLVMHDKKEQEKSLGRLEGRLRLDEDIPVFALHVEIRCGGVQRDREVGPFGYFGLPGAKPGIATLEVKTQDGDWLIDRMEGVEIVAGEKATDERLQGWDLRGKIRRLEVRVLTESGQPIVNTKLRVDAHSGGGDWIETDGDGKLQMIVPAEIETYVIRSEAFGAGELQWNEPPGREITLRK